MPFNPADFASAVREDEGGEMYEDEWSTHEGAGPMDEDEYEDARPMDEDEYEDVGPMDEDGELMYEGATWPNGQDEYYSEGGE